MCALNIMRRLLGSVPFFTQIRLPMASVSMESTQPCTSSRMAAATGSSRPEGPTGFRTFFRISNMMLSLLCICNHKVFSSAWVRASWLSTSLYFTTEDGLWIYRQGTLSTTVGTPPRARWMAPASLPPETERFT